MKILKIFLLTTPIFLGGCFFDSKYDFNDPKSIERMLENKSEAEQVEFFEKIDILLPNIKSYPPEAGLQGMTYEEIIRKANVVAEEVNKYNAEALKGMAVKALISPDNSVFYIKNRGRYFAPQPGFVPKKMSYNEVLSELAKLEGGIVSAESTQLIEHSAKVVKNELIQEVVKTNPYKPRWMESERYIDLINIFREVALQPENFEKSCLDYYVYEATEHGGHSVEDAKSIGSEICKEQIKYAQACIFKNKNEIINCLNEAVPEPR